MRVFICSYSGFSLAIPIENVASIFINSKNIYNKIQIDEENKSTYISLPVIFNSPDSRIHHGIILKNLSFCNSGDDEKIILLSSEIICEQDIKKERFYSVPKIFGILNFSLVFNGIFFNQRSLGKSAVKNIPAGSLLLLLNPEQLVQNIKKELI